MTLLAVHAQERRAKPKLEKEGGSRYGGLNASNPLRVLHVVRQQND